MIINKTNPWEQRKVGELVKDHNAGIYISKDNYGEGTNVIGVGNIYDSDIFDGEIYRLGPVDDDKFLLEEGDLIYGESSLVLEGIARTVCVGKNGAGSAFAWHTRRVKLDKTKVDSHFATLELNYHPVVRKYLMSVATQTALTGMTTDGYFSAPLFLPSIQEQRKISAVFKDIDNLITLHQCKLYGITHYTFRNKSAIVLPNNTTTWEQRKLSDIMRDFIVPMRDKPKEYGGTIPWTRIEDIEGKYINGTKSNQYVSDETVRRMNLKIIPKGSLIVSASATFGVVAQVTQDLITNQTFIGLVPNDDNDLDFWYEYFLSPRARSYMRLQSAGSTIFYIAREKFENMEVFVPTLHDEQRKIGSLLSKLDDTITLHQRECSRYFYNHFDSLSAASSHYQEVNNMLESVYKNDYFCDYYLRWITVYKEGAIRKITMEKYRMTHSWIKRLAPNLKVGELTRVTYQELLNEYAKYHEKQTTMDFHHQIKCAVLDAVDEGLIDRDPTRKAIIKGKTPRNKKPKFLNQYELHQMLDTLELGKEADWEWFILLVAKTGMRFSEALALTPADFDFGHQIVSVNKTYNYKGDDGGFLPTKNDSSIRKIQIDWRTVVQFSELVKDLPENQPIFVNKRPFNSTVNGILARHCKEAGVPIITIHGLRHTHASILLFAGVSIASVARRLGHSSMNTTQKTYLHIIQELENKDINIVMRSLSELD